MIKKNKSDFDFDLQTRTFLLPRGTGRTGMWMTRLQNVAEQT
jgi:hypothetical protein